jgi:hypothetical protein
LTKVDFPTLGAPINATKPQRVGDSAIAPLRLDAFTRQHRGGRGLFGSTLGTAHALGWFALRQRHGHAELRIMIRSPAFDLAIDAETDTRDGLRLAWKRSWLHVRPSNTEPIVRAMAEAPTREESEKLCQAVAECLAA